MNSGMRSIEARVDSRSEKFFAFGNAENQDGERGESCCVALRVGERNFLVTRLDVKVCAAYFRAAHFAGDRNRKRSGGACRAKRCNRCAGGSGMRDHDDYIARAESDRVIHQFKGLLEVRPDASVGEFAHPKFCDLCSVKRSADANKRDPLFFGGCIGGAFDIGAAAENFFDERGLRVNRVI